MNRRVIRGITTSMTRVVAALLAAAALYADTTFTFQNGANGYSGAKDFSINTQYADSNGGNGVRWTGGSELGCYNITGTGGYLVRYLLEFGSLTVPAGSHVVSATLTLTPDYWNNGPGNITVFYLKNAWNPASSRMGWLHRDSSLDWAGPGASAAGVDTVAGKSFQLPALRPAGIQTVNMALDPAVVQTWIDNPAANQGVMLVNNLNDDVVNLVSTTGTQKNRPKLTIVVAGSTAVSVSISPATAAVQAGQTKQFTASVTGSSNTAVTWTATGGTISNTGLFTAGSATGSFAVTATSAADTTKSATAQVTVQAAPAVSVSISPATATVQAGQTKQFTATVTGSSNTAVTWTATGGTVSNTGLFTAGSATGSFAVTATSAADTTKSATAQVTVQAAPAVSVSISPVATTLQTGGTQQFTATVTGSSNTAVTWTATGGTISNTGLFTAGPTAGSFAVTATSAADTTKKATANVTINPVSGLMPVPRQFDGPYVVMQSPASGMHFTAPATIRMFADPFDGDAADPDTLTVNFLMNGQSVGAFTGSDANNGLFTLTVNNVAAGTYMLTAQINSVRHGVVTSFPVTIFVDSPALSSGPVFNLASDVVLTGSQTAAYLGTPGNPCQINGNGFQIRSNAGFTGSLTIANCNIRGLGSASTDSIDVTVNGSGSVQLTGNTFDTFGRIEVSANDQAQAVIRGNEFRENTLVPVGSQPEDASTDTVPVFIGSGTSTAQKLFQANNVGLSTVVFLNTGNWLIGGSTDADSNVLMGVRCGFRITGSSGIVLRGNYSQHNYPHRFSQGENFQLDGDGFLAEHNVIRSSSWPVRGMGGELRYNLIDASGNSDQVIQGPMANANMHHNIFIFTVSQTFYSPGAGLHLLYSVDGVQFHNNTMDGGGTFMAFSGSPISVTSGSFVSSFRNNVIYNYAGLDGRPMLSGEYNESTNPPLPRLRYADYNDFFNPDAPNQTNYGLSVIGVSPGAAGYAQHDAGGFNGHVNPNFTAPTSLPFPFKPEDIWSRTKKVSDVLATYRAMYTPAAGSPLIHGGDPQDGAGGNIGAIGNGESADQFGLFGSGSGTPAPPVIANFSATPNRLQSGQSATLNWSVTGATTVSIAPGVGTVTGTSTTVTPSSTTTYTLTAMNTGGSTFASTTVTVATPAISVIITPGSATVAPGGTQPFSATVTGTSNTGVTWTATGGTINANGLYTAGATTGSFTVTATSVQDTSRSATAAVTIAAPASGVTISPLTPTIFTGGTLQFTATVTGLANANVNWTATGGSISTSGLYTAGNAAGTFTVTATSVQDTTKSASTSVTVVTQTTSDHPRMILDSNTLATLRTRAAANTPQWAALKGVCDSMVGGTVEFPDGNAYPDLPSVGEGYQGSSYWDAVAPLGICYQVLKTTDPNTAAKYGAKGVAILAAMSDPNHQVVDGTQIYVRDDGYGIRFYGTTMAIAYDWFHELVTPQLQSQVQTVLNSWITTFETNSQVAFEYENVLGNYYAGYYAAKCYSALAVQGDNPMADTWWNDWLTKEHNQRVVPYYAANMTGGGWPEGFANYGPLSTRNMLLPTLAVRSAKGLDLIHAAQPFTFPLDQARWIMHFTWPSRDMIDDRDGAHSNSEGDPVWPGTGDPNTYSLLAGYLAMWNDPLAPAMHRYARDAKAALVPAGAGTPDEWVEFLFWDNNAPEADYSTGATSYVTSGIEEASARSDWSNAATWMSFRSGPYINNPGAGHQGFDAGSLALVRGRSPLLVNSAVWIMHNPGGDAGENAQYDDLFGNWDLDHTLGNRRFDNTFQVRHLDSSGTPLHEYGQWAMLRTDGARTRISRFEDGGSYVMALGVNLEDMYRPLTEICSTSPVTSWSREIVYLRPSQFVVYDRTGVCNTALDQYMAWHFPGAPTEVTAPAAGVRRFDVSFAGAFAGSMTTLLPAAAQVDITDHMSPDPNVWNKVWRSEIRFTGASAANHQWLAVFDLASSSAQVASAVPLTVNAGPVTGVVLQSPAGNSALVFGTAAAGTAISGTVTYTVPAAQTRHVISDLTPLGAYTLTVSANGSTHVVTVTPGGNTHASANGVLSFALTPAGVVQP